jgi:glycosyltransferase involved in cell wall biosynthesis
MPLRILFLDQFGTFGGAQRVLWEVLRSLPASRYVPAIALNGEGDFHDALKVSGFRVIRLPLGSYRSVRKSWTDRLRFFWKTAHCAVELIGLVVWESIDVMYANGPRTFVCASVAGKLSRRPVIWHLHNVLEEQTELRLLAFLSGWTDQIISCSSAAAEPLLKVQPQLRSRITVIRNPAPNWAVQGVESLQRINPFFESRGGDTGVGILGRVTPFKGQLQFVQAAKLVVCQFEQAHFWVIGSPEPGSSQDQQYLQEVRRQVEESGLSAKFSFVPHQEPVAPYYALLDIVVIASQGPEALAMTAIEAMALGKGIVAPDAGGNSEIIEDEETGLLAPDATPEALARQILRLLHDTNLRKRLGQKAWTVARQRFSLDSFQKQVMQIVDSAAR